MGILNFKIINFNLMTVFNYLSFFYKCVKCVYEGDDGGNLLLREKIVIKSS